MNIVISLITFQCLRLNWEVKRPISTKSSILIILGIIAPLGDYILRIILGEIWFQTSGLVFHSFIYHGLLWGVMALLHWVYQRNIRQAVIWLLPLTGLFTYFIFTVLSTEALPFFSPLSDIRLSLNWVNSGHLIPLILAVAFWITKKWTHLNRVLISRVSLGIFLVYIISMGTIQINIKRMLAETPIQNSMVNITPARFLPLDWDVVTYANNHYQVRRYQLVNGWIDEVLEPDAFHNFDMSQNALRDPKIFRIVSSAFKNPVISTTIQNETMMVEISEVVPSSEILWIDNLQLIINRTGQLVDYHVDFRTIRL